MRSGGWATVAASVAALLCVGCGASGPAGSANASCVGPQLDDRPPGSVTSASARTLAPGDTITVYGRWYTSTCDDTGRHEALVPLPAVHLTLELPGGSVVTLGDFSPDGSDMGFSVRVRVPVGTPAGVALVHDDREPAATYRFTVGG